MKPGGWFSTRTALIVGVTAIVAGCGGSGDEPFSDARAEQLTKRLRHGGNVLLMRHAAEQRVDVSPGFEDCSTRRYLSAEGRRQALTVRRALRGLDASTEQVMTSPLCQAVETGSLVTGSAFASRSLLPPTLLKRVLKPSDGPDYSLGLQIASHLDTPSNAVLVSHRATIAKETGAQLNEGDTLVLAPAPFDDPEYRVVARLSPSDWSWLASR